MASDSVQVAEGITVTIAGSTVDTQELLDVDWSGASRELIETTHQGTAAAGAGKFGNKTFIGSRMNNGGILTIVFHFNPDEIPDLENTETGAAIVLTWPQGGAVSPANWAFNGILQDYSISAALGNKMTCTAAYQVSGNVTVTAGG